MVKVDKLKLERLITYQREMLELLERLNQMLERGAYPTEIQECLGDEVEELIARVQG